MLSRIKHLLFEAASNKEFNLNDAKGKLFEILVGSHLRHGADKNGKPAGFLTHYRDEDNKTPEAVHDYIKREMNRRHPGMYDQINQHANEAASHMRNQMAADGHTEFHDVAWTSQPSDHASFTGVKDPNSDADVMLRTNKGHVGVSLKYGTQKSPNLRNTGLATIESLANLKNGAITDVFDEHRENIKRYGYTGTAAQNHEAYKANKDSESAKAAEESSLNARREIAKRWQDGYSRMSSDELRSKISRLVSPKTKFQHYRLHTRPTAAGVQHNMAGIQEEVEGLLNHYAEFKAVPHSGDSINVQILGRHHDSDEWHPVIVHGVKGVSGPMQNFNGTTQLKLRKPKAAKAAKSTSKTPALTPTPAPAKPRAVKKPTPKAKLISKAKPIDIPPMDTSRPLSARLGENYLRKIIKESKMANDKKSAEEKGEYDYEGDMAKSQLKSIIANAQRMHDMLEETTNLPEWVQSKITLAEDYILTATNYMEGEMSEEYSIQEKINIANSDMGKVIKDFYKSGAPQFAGRSKEKRRQMAIAAKLGAMRKSKMSEELKGNQHKIDANKNNKIDAHDFKLLRSKLKVKKGEAQNVGEAVIAPRPSIRDNNDYRAPSPSIRNNNDMRTNLKPKKPKPYSTPSKDNNHNQPRGTSADVAPNKKRIPLKQKPTSYSTPSKHNQPRGTSDVKNRLIGLRKEEVEQVNEILPFLAGALARGAATRLGASAATRAATGKAASSAARVASYRGRVNVDGGGEEDNGEYEDPRGSVVQRYTSPDMDDTEQKPVNYSTAAAREADRVRKMQNQNRNLRKTTTEEVEQVDEVIGNTTGYSDSGPRNTADDRRVHQNRNVVTRGPRTGKITKYAQNRLKARLKDKTYMEEVEIDEGAVKATNKFKKRLYQAAQSATKVTPQGNAAWTRAAAIRMTRDKMKKEEASPMIKPPSNRFDNRKDAFAHLEKIKKTGGKGKVLRHEYVNPRTGMKSTTYSVKQEVEQIGEAPYMGKGNHKPGWMLRADPGLADKFKEIEARRKRMDSLMKTYGGKTGDEIDKMKKK